jgi:glucokinase
MDLIADIGATNTRCGLLDGKGRLTAVEVFHNVDHSGIHEVLTTYLSHRRADDRPRRAALAVAAPIEADQVSMLNIDWAFSQSDLKRRLRLTRLLVVNDFAAIAWGLPRLAPADLHAVGAGVPNSEAPRAALGPGSGLGVATFVPSADGGTVASGEGGHVTLPATTNEEATVIAVLRDHFEHCSAERVLSGPGILNLYRALGRIAGSAAEASEPAQVAAAARLGDALARKTIEMFFAMLGTVAGDLALTVGALGGVYIAGGIAPKLLDLLGQSSFRDRFEAKGRYRSYLQGIPTYVITSPLPAFGGLRRLLGYR